VKRKILRVLVLLAGAALCVAWSTIARYTTMRCDVAACTYTERRVLSFLVVRRVDVPRSALALEVKIRDTNRRGAELVALHPDGDLRIAEGSESEMNARKTEFPSRAAVDDSVYPHTFGLIALGVLAFVLIVGFASLRRPS
jgi:hypothetical protein